MSTPPQQPPSYSSSNSPICSPPSIDEPLSLVVEGTRIFSTTNPSRTLYQLSQPVLAGQAKTIAIEKLVYRVADIDHPTYEDGDRKDSNMAQDRKIEIESEKVPPVPESGNSAGPSSERDKQASQQKPFSMLDISPSPPRGAYQGPKVKYHRNHIYDVKPTGFGVTGGNLTIEGVSKRSFQGGTLQRATIGKSWSMRVNEGIQWKCEPGSSIRNKVKGKEATVWEWRDKGGKLLAEEVKELIAEGDVVAGTNDDLTKTRLDFQTGVGEKEMEIIVTGWVGRVAFEAREKADPMTWKKFKNIAETKSGNGKMGIYYG